jgi:phosphatidate cytidylyltransferase
MPSPQNHHDAQEALESINKRTGRNMPQAIATGAVLVVLIGGTLLISPHAFAYLLIAFMVMGIWELRVDFATIGIHISPIALWLCSILMLLCSYYFSDHILALGATLMISLLVVSLAAAFNPFSGGRVHRAVASKVTVSQEATPPFQGRLADICVSIFSVLYIPLLAAFLVFLLVQPSPQIKVMMAIFIPALGDTGGLVFGAALGKHKLSPRISPKKSYEGLAGSILFCVIGTLLFYGFAFQTDFLDGGWWKPIVMGIVIAITGTFGDLCASMLKRDIGIKDMGHLLKGHGGILDRVDSILISAPFFFALFTLFGV